MRGDNRKKIRSIFHFVGWILFRLVLRFHLCVHCDCISFDLFVSDCWFLVFVRHAPAHAYLFPARWRSQQTTNVRENVSKKCSSFFFFAKQRAISRDANWELLAILPWPNPAECVSPIQRHPTVNTERKIPRFLCDPRSQEPMCGDIKSSKSSSFGFFIPFGFAIKINWMVQQIKWQQIYEPILCVAHIPFSWIICIRFIFRYSVHTTAITQSVFRHCTWMVHNVGVP